MKADEIISLSFLAICFVRVGVNIRVQTMFLYQSLWHAVQGQAGVERRAVRDLPEHSIHVTHHVTPSSGVNASGGHGASHVCRFIAMR